MTAPKDCPRCPALVKCRTNVVNGWGSPNARYFFCGQNPGAAEDAQARPFVGPSGRVLATMIRSAGIEVEDIFLSNSTMCLTPANRKPKKDEWGNCRDYILEEIRDVNPSVIITLGEVATHSLYGKVPLSSVLGQTLVQADTGIALLPTYHPAFILRGQWNAVPVILSHLEKARRIVEGTQQVGTLGEYVTIKTVAQLEALRDYLLAAPMIFLDSETTGTDWKDAELLCLSFSTQPYEGFVVPILQQGARPCWNVRDGPRVETIIGEILASPIPKGLQNAGFDIRFIEREPAPWIGARTAFGWRLNNLQEDTMLMHRLTAEHLPKETKPNELPHLLSAYSDMPGYEDELRTQSKNKTRMEEVENDVLHFYAAADADAVARLVPILGKQLDEDGGSRWIYQNISIPMVRCCQEMTQRGMLVDRPYFKALTDYYEQRHIDLLAEAIKLAGKKFNPNSPLQVQDVLFNKLKLPKSGRKTDGARECAACEKNACEKHDQVSEDALLDIKARQDHPIIDVLILLRQVMKLRGTYLAGTGEESGGFLQHIRADGRIHPEFKSGGAATGRLTSANPTGQNIPTRIEIEELKTLDAFHRTFIAPPGHVLASPDWSQAEIWTLAYETGDVTLKEILESGRDIHTIVGRHLFPIDLEMDEFEWQKEHDDLRRDAKVFSFGIAYGLTIPGIMERLHCSEGEANSLLNTFLDLLPSLRDYVEQTRAIVMEGGVLVNRFGRRKHFPQVPVMRECGARMDLEELCREAVNFKIQSGASDLHSLAHISTESSPAMREIFSIVNAVHDSCLAEVPAPDFATTLDTAWKVKHLWQEIALNTELADGSKLGWQIPVEVKWSEVGGSWGDMPYTLTAKGSLLYQGQPVDSDLHVTVPAL